MQFIKSQSRFFDIRKDDFTIISKSLFKENAILAKNVSKNTKKYQNMRSCIETHFNFHC